MAPVKHPSRRLFAVVLAAALLSACSGAQEPPPGIESSSDTSPATESAEPIQATASGDVTVLAGSMIPGRVDGNALDAQFIKPYGICAGQDGTLILADSYGNQLREIQDNSVTTLAGAPSDTAIAGFPPGGYQNGDASQALLNRPRFMDVSAEGMIVFSDSENNMIRVCDGQQVYPMAGAPEGGYRDGDSKDARFSLPSGVAISNEGAVYVADTLNHCIRIISPEGQVSTLTGHADEPGFQDGTLAEARFYEPNDIACSPDGALYVVDKGNQRIRRVFNGEVTTVAGCGTDTDQTTGYIIGGYQDGSGGDAKFLYPTGLCVSDDGTIFIADTGNNCVRALTTDGRVVTVAGKRTAGNRVGNLEETRFNQPLDVLYRDGILYVTDSYNHVVKSMELDLSSLHS